jgi:hypothetical protein
MGRGAWRGDMLRPGVGPETMVAPKNHKPFKRQLQRIRRMCLALADTTEKLSHGEPTFFTKQGVFAMFANDHHGDGYVGVWLPAPPGLQEALIEEAPSVYYRPPYVGSSGWIGIDLPQIHDDALNGHIREAYRLVVSKKARKTRSSASRMIQR